MSWIDINLLVLIVGFTVVGFAVGFVQMAGNLLGTIIGIVLASRLTGTVAGWVGAAEAGWARVTVFLVLYGIVSGLFGLVTWVASMAFGLVKLVPLVPTVNRLLGAVLGAAAGVVTVGAALFVAGQLLPPETVRSAIETSVVAGPLVSLMRLSTFLLPEALRVIQD